MTVLPRGAKNRRGGRRPGWLLLTALLVLAILASATLVFTSRVELLRLAVILSLWAAVLAAFVSVIYRRQSQLDAAKARDMKFVYDLQLDREISARREYELAVEAHLRRQLAVELRAQAADEMGALRAELATLRANLQALLGTDLGDRPALESERPMERAVERAMDAPRAEPLAMPPAPGRVHSSRVRTATGEFAVHAEMTEVEVTQVIVAEVAVGAESPILDVPEEPLVPAPPQPPPAAPLPPAVPPPAQRGRRPQAPPVDHHRPPPPPVRDRGSHRRSETRDSGSRPTAAPRQPVPPRPTAAPAPPVAPPRPVPPGPPPARPPVPPPPPPTPWRPPETRTRPGRHRGFEEPAPVPPVEPGPVPQHRSPGGRHSNADPDDNGAEAAGRHRNAEAHVAVEQAPAEDPQGQHAGGAPVADLVARLSGTGKANGKGGGRRRRRED